MQFSPTRPRRLNLIAACVLLCFSVACASSTVQAPTAAPTVIPSPTPIPSPTLAPPTATTAPTAIPSPTLAPPTATTAPTAIPSPTLAPPTPVPPTATAAPIAPPAPVRPEEANLPPIDPALSARLQQILDQLVADRFIPGATLAVNIPGYQTWVGASGYADRASTRPMTPETRVRIASISKIFTAVVIHQLVEEGRLSLDQPLSTWYPDLVPGADLITVRMLLNHTTGLYDYLEDREYQSKAYGSPQRIWEPAELVAHAAKSPPLFAPGAPGEWDYSSTNYVILGMIVEAVTGNSLALEMRQRIFVPLGLASTYFPPDEEIVGEKADGHFRELDYTPISLSFGFATANLVSTVDDVQRFGRALFNGQLLAPETMAQLATFENGKGQYRMPDLEYGLGVMRNKLPVGPDPGGRERDPSLRTVLGHTGGFGGFRSVLWHAPETGVTIALGENQGATDPNILATKVLDAVLTSQGR